MRQDIQCLRGIAILLVFVFHLSPSLFINGFLGVDMFFVISGFLMAKSLHNLKLRNVKEFLNFYYKRFRRILPLYYFMVFLIVVMVHLYLGDFIWESNNRYSLASLLLVANQLIIHDQTQYFSEYLASTSSMNGFLHFWSLSVEVQFYLFVPVIFMGLSVLKHGYLKLIAVSLITILGFLVFTLVNAQFAFNFMFLRLWQFSAGFTALFWSETNEKLILKISEKEKKSVHFPLTKDELVTIALSIIALCLLPREINVLVLRPLVTLATAFIIASETADNTLLKSKTLGYIGDISYVMYLIHWPVISIFLSSSIECFLLCIVITIVSSVLLHHLFEKQYLKLGQAGIFTLLTLLIGGNAFLQYSIRNHNFWKSDFSLETTRIIDENRPSFRALWDVEPRKDSCINNTIDIPEGLKEYAEYCQYPPGNGNISIMMIGNSYVLNLGEHIRAHFNYNYSHYRYMSSIENFGICTFDSLRSKLGVEYAKEQVELHKPDVLFIVARYYGGIKQPIKEDDEIIREINENIAFYEKFVKKLYILDAFPLHRQNFVTWFLHNVITRPEDLEQLHLDKSRADREMKPVKQRFERIKCKNCSIFDLSHVFISGSQYLTFERDTKMSYVDNSIHLSGAGVQLCEPIFKKIADEIMSTF